MVVATQQRAGENFARVLQLGDLFVERFGFGSASAVFRVDAAGHVTLTSDANPSRRRLGLAVLSRTELLSSWFVKQGDDPAQGGVSLVTRDPASSRATERDIVAGLGIAVSSLWGCRTEIERGVLVRLLEEWTLPPVELHAVYHSGRRAATAVRALVAHLAAQF